MIYIHLIPGCHRELDKQFKRIGNRFTNIRIEVLSDGLAIYQDGLLFPYTVSYNENMDFYIDEKNFDFGLVGH